MKSLVLINRFLKKNISKIVILSAIIVISSFLFSVALFLQRGINQEYDKKYNQLNTADIHFIVENKENIKNILSNEKDKLLIKNFEIFEGILVNSKVKFSDEIQEQKQIIYSIKSSNLNKVNIIEENSSIKNGIYLPYYLKVNGNYQVSDDYEITINDQKYSFKVKGFIEEMVYGNYHNSLIAVYVSEEIFSDLKDNNIVLTLAFKTSDIENSQKIISNLLIEKNISILKQFNSIDSKQMRLLVSEIIILLFFSFSMVLLVLGLIVIKFKLSEYLRDEFKAVGILKAIGHSNFGIMISIIFPYVFVVIGSSFLGGIFSYLCLDYFTNLISMQSGFIWESSLDLFSIIFSVVLILLVTLLFIIPTVMKIKKVKPIQAINNYFLSDKGFKNRFSLEKIKFSLLFTLSIKNLFNNLKSNILLGLSILVLAVLTSLAFVLYYNVNANPQNFINTLVEEHPSLIVNTPLDIRKSLKEKDNVKDAIYYSDNENVIVNGDTIKAFISEDFSKVENPLIYEGRSPRTDEEIALGSFIKEKYNYKIGDVIAVNYKDAIYNYIITGFIQTVNYNGKAVEITLDGFKRLNPIYEPTSIYVYLIDENKGEDFINNVLEKEFEIKNVMNYSESLESASAMYTSIIKVFCVIILFIVFTIVFFTIYILFSTIISKQKIDFGILKSLGYTDYQIMVQLIGGFLITSFISAFLGSLLNILLMPNILREMFMLIGVYKLKFLFPEYLFFLASILLVFFSFIIFVFISRRIKKIEIKLLIQE